MITAHYQPITLSLKKLYYNGPTAHLLLLLILLNSNFRYARFAGNLCVPRLFSSLFLTFVLWLLWHVHFPQGMSKALSILFYSILLYIIFARQDDTVITIIIIKNIDSNSNPHQAAPCSACMRFVIHDDTWLVYMLLLICRDNSFSEWIANPFLCLMHVNACFPPFISLCRPWMEPITQNTWLVLQRKITAINAMRLFCKALMWSRLQIHPPAHALSSTCTAKQWRLQLLSREFLLGTWKNSCLQGDTSDSDAFAVQSASLFILFYNSPPNLVVCFCFFLPAAFSQTHRSLVFQEGTCEG